MTILSEIKSLLSHNNAVNFYKAGAIIALQKKCNGHHHARLMLEYAIDALTNPKPWTLWQVQLENGNWFEMTFTPVWHSHHNYRRNPNLPISQYSLLFSNNPSTVALKETS